MQVGDIKREGKMEYIILSVDGKYSTYEDNNHFYCNESKQLCNKTCLHSCQERVTGQAFTHEMEKLKSKL